MQFRAYSVYSVVFMIESEEENVPEYLNNVDNDQVCFYEIYNVLVSSLRKLQAE